MKDRTLKKILVIGSGPIVIGQAAEFDYAGVQACRALKEEKIEIVLVNSNPATIMTDEEIEEAGYRAGVYFNQSYGYNSFDLIELRDYEFWLAEYADTQSFAYEVQLWQYNCEATLPGIETTIDLNLCYYDYLKEEESQDDGTAQEE